MPPVDVLLRAHNSARVWNPQLFGLRVKEARKNRGLTLAQLSKLTDIDQGELSRIEQGKRPSVGLPNVLRICEALRLDLETLVYGRPQTRGQSYPPK